MKDVKDVRDILRGKLLRSKAKITVIIKKGASDIAYIDKKLDELDELDRLDKIESEGFEKVKKRGLFFWK